MKKGTAAPLTVDVKRGRGTSYIPATAEQLPIETPSVRDAHRGQTASLRDFLTVKLPRREAPANLLFAIKDKINRQE